MKADTHPQFTMVLFKDTTCDFSFIAGTATNPKNFSGTETVDGVEYPVLKIEVSSASHPFYTGKQKSLGSQGKVERFLRKYGMYDAAVAKEEAQNEAQNEA